MDSEGLAQAEALAAYLRPEQIDGAVCSDLIRARMTAEFVCAGRGIEPATDVGLREMHFGAWEGLTWSEIVERWPELAAGFEFSPRSYVPENGEAWADVCARVEAALRRFTAGLPSTGRGLVVSHAGVMHAILQIVRVLAGESDETELRVRLAPASIVRLSGSFAAGWRVDAVNETAPAASPT